MPDRNPVRLTQKEKKKQRSVSRIHFTKPVEPAMPFTAPGALVSETLQA